MIEALLSGAMCGAWLVGFFSVAFVGVTVIAAFVKLARAFSGHPQG